MNAQELWATALNDADDPDDILLLLTENPPSDSSSLGFGYLPPGASLAAAPKPLTADERKQLIHAASRPRVAIFRGLDDRLMLAAMRWALEVDRQRRANRQILRFGQLLNGSLDGVFTGPGSAVVWHCLPNIKDADLAASYLVKQIFGDQPGEFHGPHGVLLRTDRPEPDIATLPRRLVVTAAIFAEHFDAQLSGAESRDLLLRDLDDAAPAWWRTALDDDGFEHLRKSLPFYVPSEDEIDELLPMKGQASAWEPWKRHFFLALDEGMRVGS